MTQPGSDNATPQPWCAEARLRFLRRGDHTSHQGSASSPLKLQRAFRQSSGHCELPLLHTAGGLVGGDELRITAELEPGSRALLTSVAAQKVYGSVGRSHLAPAGLWARQDLHMTLAERADLEWLPQELVLYADGLYSQRLRVELAAGASWLGAEVVRLGRTAAGEQLAQGRWRSSLELVRQRPEGRRWELVDRIELADAALQGEHGMAGQPVFGSLVWAAPQPLAGEALADLLAEARQARAGLEGEMACGALEQGLVARYRGPSTTAARTWFTRLWAAIRRRRGLPAPELPRCWPFQEEPLRSAPSPGGSAAAARGSGAAG